MLANDNKLKLPYDLDSEKFFNVEITIAPDAERFFTKTDPKTRSEFFNHALEHALQTAWLARELQLLDAKREVQPSSMLSELTGQRTYLLSGSKVFGQAIKERMVLGYVENQMSGRWKELEEFAKLAKNNLGTVRTKGITELMKAKEAFLRAHKVTFATASSIDPKNVLNEPHSPIQRTAEASLPDAKERFYIALWESLQEAPLIAPTSGSYGISCFQIVSALRNHLVRVGGHDVPLLMSDKGGPVAFVPALPLNIMPLDKFGHLHHSCFNAGCSTTDHIVEWHHRGARDVMALLKAQAVQGIFAPTNPKSVQEVQELLLTAMDPKLRLDKPILDSKKTEQLLREVSQFAAQGTWKEDLKHQRPIQLPPELRRKLLDLEIVSDKQVMACLHDPYEIYAINRHSKTNEEVRTFRNKLVIRHIGDVLKPADNFDLFFSPSAQKAFSSMGVHIYDRKTRGQKNRPKRENLNIMPEGLDLEITKPIEAGLYGLMVPRLQHLEEMLTVNEQRTKSGAEPIKELMTYNQPSVGATLAAAALTDWIVNSGIRLTDTNKELLQDLFPHIAQAMEAKRKDKKDFPIKLTLVATPDTATLHPGSLARELGYKGTSYNNDGIPANGLGTLTPGQLPLKILQQCMNAKEASFKLGGVYPAPDALMEIGRMVLFVTNIHAQVLTAREIGYAKGLKDEDGSMHELVVHEAEKARYPEEAAAASLAGYMLQMINGMSNPDDVRKYAGRCAEQLKTYGLTFESMKQLLPKSGLQQLNHQAQLHGEPVTTFLQSFLDHMKYDAPSLPANTEKNFSKTNPDNWVSRVGGQPPMLSTVNETQALTFYDTGRNGPEVSNDVRMEIRNIIEHMKETGVDKKGTLHSPHGQERHHADSVRRQSGDPHPRR